jgi:hypothetical protein
MNNSIEQKLKTQYICKMNIYKPFSLYDKNLKNLTIIYSDVDYDIHVLPFVENINQKYGLAEIFFSYSEFPIFSKALIILAHAIELDNKNGKKNQPITEHTDFNNLIDFFFSSFEKLTIESNKSFSIRHDDFEGNVNNVLKVSTYQDGLSISAKDINGVRFRTMAGGGRSFCVRNALTLLCYLIQKNKL